MSASLISEDELERIHYRLDDINQKLSKKLSSEPDQTWFDNQEFIQVMNISKRTAAYWRTANIIAYSQVGNKIYYRLTDILELLKKYTVPASSTTNQIPLTDGQDNDL
ncbi:MAG: hypothetical protein A2W95_10550 [Bacteroidetes bacterium GWA2_40_14]|nr:MAG: hypothetical protein A2W95_10550 [Bacteroidetes bacterium GWA2_40_14]HAZ04504.1 DNA-binding protein [Marinilabiliales bacterium]